MSCSVGTCSLEPLFLCSCEGNSKALCEFHSGFHLNEYPDHKIKLFNSPISLQEKKSIISTILNEVQALNLLKLRLEQVSKILINTINLSLSRALSPIIKSQATLLSKVSEISTSTSIKSSEYEKFLNDEDLIFKINPVHLDYFTQILEIDSFYTKDFLSLIEKVNKKSEGLSNTFSFFNKNSGTLFSLNPFTEELDSSELKLEKSMGGSAGTCLLPNKKVFYYGGQFSVMTWPSDLCSIIDPELKKVEFRAKGPKRMYNIGTCAYLNGKVFMFGGSGKCRLLCNNAFEYSIEEDTWKSISYLPIGSENNCALAAFGGIAVTGQRLGGYLYDVEKDVYEEKMQKSEGGKVLLDCGRNLVVLVNGGVMVWSQDGKVEAVNGATGLCSELYMKSYPVIHSYWIYFLLSDKNLYRIHHRTFVLEKLRKYDVLFR